MKKYEAIGVIEAKYFPVAMELLDQVCKATNVEFVSSEKYLGGRLVSLIVGGQIAEVQEAIRVAEQVGETKPGSPLKKAIVITNPHEEILKFLIAPEEKANKKTKTKSKKNKAKTLPKEEK